MRSKGCVSFILRQGILRHGMLAASILTALQVTAIIFCTKVSIPLFGVALGWLLSTIVLGSLIGFVLWKQHEKDYHNDEGAAS